MEERLAKLKMDFNNIITIRNSVKNVFDILQSIIYKLRQIYSEFIDNNKNDIFIFGLDSFNFQSKLIDIEYDDMKRLFLVINNRMYCEYFKLHKIIVEYISKNINDKKNNDIKNYNFPIYKDLEPFKEYKFELVLEIHEDILNLLSTINSIIINKENQLLIHKAKQNIGLNIDNYITTFNFNNKVMRDKLNMYITYIEFFHKLHSKYLKRFNNKIQLMYTNISHDIKLDDSVEISKNKKQQLINEITSDNIDKNLLKEIKSSIGSETNSDDSIISTSKPNTPLSINITNSLDLEKELPSRVYNLDDLKDNLSISSVNMELINKNIHDNKNGFKNIFRKNVNKITNVLGLCKPKINTSNNTQLSNNQINDMFIGIDKSCDSIINENENENITLKIESIDEINNSNYYNFVEEKLDTINKHTTEYNETDSIISDTIQQLPHESDIIEEKSTEKVVIEEKSNEKLVIEEKQEHQTNSVYDCTGTIDGEKINQLSKKKRGYNKKKK
jgi:hypothetical protein